MPDLDPDDWAAADEAVSRALRESFEPLVPRRHIDPETFGTRSIFPKPHEGEEDDQ